MQIPPQTTQPPADVMDSWQGVRGFLADSTGDTSFEPDALSPPGTARRRQRRERSLIDVFSDESFADWSVDSIAEEGDGSEGDDHATSGVGDSSGVEDRGKQRETLGRHVRSDTERTVRPFFAGQGGGGGGEEGLVMSPVEERGPVLGWAEGTRRVSRGARS